MWSDLLLPLLAGAVALLAVLAAAGSPLLLCWAWALYQDAKRASVDWP